ncbi:MAG: M23 family metallopeptidase [candidate division Zixibacteria bacterium]|nr:M23 family metallopeptidase [candidate division Zixibacteria bacterium]
MNISAIRTAALAIMMAAIAFAAPAEPYLWPLPFGKELTSIFGDSRTRRYHLGIDMRTNGEIGKVVVAPMAGYISRIRTSYFGYGKALHLTMKDGNSAVFAHLSRFTPVIEEFVRQKQIASETYNQDIELTAGKFDVRQGDTIAYSGSTGVGAPHLHFEVRTSGNVPLNPLTLPGLNVADNSPPEFRSLRLIGFGNDDLAAALGWTLEYKFRKSPGTAEYTVNTPLPCGLDDYWLAVEAVDRVGISTWNKPVYEIEARASGREFYRLKYDRVAFEDNYLIDAQRNFDQSVLGNQEFYNLVPLKLPQTASGICAWFGDQIAPLEIVARDAAGNSARATVSFYDAHASDAKGFRPRPDTLKLAKLLQKYGDVPKGKLGAAMIPAGNRLFLLVQTPDSRVESVTANSSSALESASQPAILTNIAGRFWIGAIDSLAATGALIAGDSLTIAVKSSGVTDFANVPVNCGRIFTDASSAGTLKSRDGAFVVKFAPYSDAFFPLDPNLYFRLDRESNGKFAVYKPAPDVVPLIKPVTYEFDLGGPIPRGAGLYSVEGNKRYYLGGETKGNVISVQANTLAAITVQQDTLPPTFRRVRPAANAIVTTAKPAVTFAISDDLSGIRDKIDVYIDGRWVIPVYDYESGTVMAEPHFNLTRGKHKLEIKAADKQGNVARYVCEFTYGSRKKK